MGALNKNFWKFTLGFLVIIVVGLVAFYLLNGYNETDTGYQVQKDSLQTAESAE